MRTLIGFTSGAFAGSVAQANYAAAKGGIVSLARGRGRNVPVRRHRQLDRAGGAQARMTGNVPMEIVEIGDAEDVAPMVGFLLSDKARQITGQMYTANGREDRGVEPAGRSARHAHGRPLDAG